MSGLGKRALGRTRLMATELGFGAMNIPNVEEGELIKTISAFSL